MARARRREFLPTSLNSYDKKNGEAPWLYGLPHLGASQLPVTMESRYSRLHDEIMAYVDYMTPTPEEETIVADVGKRVCTVLKKAFKNCKVHTSGSTASGLRLPESDIDLVIETTDFVTPKYHLMKLARLVRDEELCESLEERRGARVPIIKFLTKPGFGSLNFDVGINSTEGLKNGEWVKERLKTMPALRPLVLVIKGALSQRDLNDASQQRLNDASKNGLSSFAVICMCVFFLEYNPYNLPKEDITDPIKSRSLGSLLFRFLTYYSEKIPYENRYISVSGNCLKLKYGASWIKYHCDGNLVIQCPNDSRRNITAALWLDNWNKIQRIFGQATKGMMRPYKYLRGGLLGTLVLVNSEFIERRQYTKQLVQSGRLKENLERKNPTSSSAESRTSRSSSTMRSGVSYSDVKATDFSQRDMSIESGLGKSLENISVN